MPQAQVEITDLPRALALTGSESVPIVQNGVTVQTTTGAISGAGALNYPFLTVGSTFGLTEARYISVSSGLSLTDNGAGSTLQINLTGSALSLDSSGTGLIVKTGANTVTGRSFEVSAGLTIANADGVSGNPLVSLGSFLSHLVSLTGTGVLAIQSGTVGKINFLGTTNQISIVNGDGSGDVTVSMASNPILPGTGSVTIPVGTTAQQPAGSPGMIRYNSTTQTIDGYVAGTWRSFSVSGGVNTFSAGSTGFSPNTPTSGAVTLSGILNSASGGTGINNGTYTITLGGNVSTGGSFTTSGAYALTLTATASTNVTLPTTGTLATLAGSEILTNKTISGASNTLSNIGNSSLTYSTITVNGTTISLGGSGTVTAAVPYALTIGTGLSGTSYDGSAPVTIANTGVLSWSGGTTGFTPSTATNGAVTLAGTLVVANGGTGATTASGARTNLGAAASGANSDITSLSGLTGGISSPTSITMGNGNAVTVSAGVLTYTPNTGAWNLGMGGGNISQQVGEELFVYGKATAAINDSPFQIIYQTGTVGASGTITFAPTVAGITNGDLIIGAATEAIALNGFGRITSFGVIHGITTNGTAYGETWHDGDILWYNPITGNPTNVKPSAPNIKVQVAIVINAGSGGSGSVQVEISHGSVLGGTDANVQFGTLSNNDLIQYSTSLGYWKNTAPSSIVIGTATNLAGGTAGAVPYQTGAGATTFLSLGTTNYVMTAGASAPQYVAQSTLSVGAATNISGGTAGALPYNTGAGATSFLALGTTNYVLTAGASAPQYVAQSTLSVGSATNATNTAITANSTNATNYLTFVSATTGNLPQLVNSGITCNPSTGQITAGIAGGAF